MPPAPRELWRISDFIELKGLGGLYYSARWNTVGHRVVYLAESPAGALIEQLVHLELNESELPQPYNLLRVSVPENLQTEILTVAKGERWKRYLEQTQKIGNAWLESKRCALAQVPSAVLPHTYNYILNPEHSDAALFQIADVTVAEFDPRLLRKVNP